MAASTVNIHEAKTHFSKLVDRVERGEEVVIARAGKPAVKMVPLSSEAPPLAAEKPPRRLGFLEGRGYRVPDDIKTPFKDEIEEMFYGNPDKFSDL